MTRGNIYTCLWYFLFSLCVLYSFQYTDLSNTLLRSFDSFWLSFADRMTEGTYNFVSFIEKIILLQLALVLSTPAAPKTQCFAYLSFNSTLHLIISISNDLQKLLRYFNGEALFHSLEFHCYY